MEAQPIETIELDNGLNLEIYDLSRRVAGDRWYIEMRVTIPIPVTQACFSGKLPPPADMATLREALGEQVVFEHRNIRNFIGEDEKEALFSQMRESLRINARRYFSHPDFAARYLLKQYKAVLSRPKGYPA
jgi:hypothetical protein